MAAQNYGRFEQMIVAQKYLLSLKYWNHDAKMTVAVDMWLQYGDGLCVYVVIYECIWFERSQYFNGNLLFHFFLFFLFFYRDTITKSLELGEPAT